MQATAILGIGGNLRDPLHSVNHAIQLLNELDVNRFQTSFLYETTPVSDLPQPNYINAVCSFTTCLHPLKLFEHTQEIERAIGKISKEKNEPRIIDIDILFYGEQSFNFPELQIPHPRWLERLFVLKPLSDLIQSISVDQISYNISEIINHHSNFNKETITCLK